MIENATRWPLPAFSQAFSAWGFDEQSDHFAPVRVNETLTLLFDEDASFR